MDKPILKSKTIWAGLLGGLAIVIPAILCLLNGTCVFGDVIQTLLEGFAVILGAFGVRLAISNNKPS